MMKRSNDSSQPDGLPRHWPHEGVHSHQAWTTASPSTSSASTHSGQNTQSNTVQPSPPSRRASPPPPIIADTPADPLPRAATFGVEQLAESPEALNKPLPEELKEPEHTDNPDDLREHLATAVPPVSSKRATSLLLEDPGIKDLGWRDDAPRPNQLIRGIHNESLFTLVRRFNKQVHHVRAIPPPPPGLLDLDIATDEEISPEKLRANLERLYMTVIVGLAAFGKHVARIRSWNEPRRTTAFALAYFVSWYLGLLSAAVLSTLLALMFCPPSRRILFPPAPLAAVSTTTGNLQVPRAGVVGSGDSLTGAPEAHRGEAVEQEASHFVASIAAIGTETVLGQGGTPIPGRKKDAARGDVGGLDAAGEMETEAVDQGSRRTSDDSFAGALPDPSDIALRAKDVEDAVNAPGGGEDPAARVAKRSVEGAMWERMRPVMRLLADVADGWERFANALEPVPPFSKYAARLKMAAVVVPVLVASVVVPSAVVLRGISLFVGVIFFSQPALSRAVGELNRRAPHWRERVELRRTILRGVPTNAQLTLTLLRIGEQANAPLPPPPIPHPYQTATAVSAALPDTSHPPEAAEQLKDHEFAFDAGGYEVEGVAGKDDHWHELEHADPEDRGGDERAGADEGAYVAEGGSTDRESVEGGSDIDKGTGASTGTEGKRVRKRGSKLVGFLKKTTRAGVGGVLGVDRVKAKVGDEHAKRRLGAVPPRREGANSNVNLNVNLNLGGEGAMDTGTDRDQHRERDSGGNETMVSEGGAIEREREREGPTSFSARVHGKKGRVVVVSSAASPCVSFVAEKPLRTALGKGLGLGGSGAERIEGEFSIGVADIVALRKMGGFGWKGKLVVGWATGRDVLDGLEVVDRSGGRRVITAVKGRDELFNRLVSMGAQKWECL